MVHAWGSLRTVLVQILCLSVLLMLNGCLTSPIEEVREQQYSSSQSIVLLSVADIDSNLVAHHVHCGNGRWMQPGSPGETRRMVWGKRLNARKLRVDAWMEFEPLGAGRTQVTAYANAAMRETVAAYMAIIVEPTTCH